MHGFIISNLVICESISGCWISDCRYAFRVLVLLNSEKMSTIRKRFRVWLFGCDICDHHHMLIYIFKYIIHLNVCTLPMHSCIGCIFFLYYSCIVIYMYSCIGCIYWQCISIGNKNMFKVKWLSLGLQANIRWLLNLCSD